MESGVEAGDLRRRREGLHRRLDPGEIVRLVQRRERNEPLKLRDRGLVDQHRLDEIRPAVHDAMADRDDRRVVARLPEPAENGAHRRRDGRRARPTRSNVRPLVSPAAVVTAPLSGRADALDLSRSELVRLAAVDEREGGEFERRRTGVEGQDHRTPNCVTPPPWRPSALRRTRGLPGASIRKAAPARRRRAGRDRCRPGSSA